MRAALLVREEGTCVPKELVFVSQLDTENATLFQRGERARSRVLTERFVDTIAQVL